MDERLAVVLAAQGGVVSSRDAARVQVSAIALDALVRSGDLARVHRGAYVLRELHDAGNPEERYRLRTMAILRTRPTLDAASHHASVLMYGVDTHGVDLSVVDVITKVKSPRVRSGLRTHPGAGLGVATTGIHRVVRLPIARGRRAGRRR